MGAWRDAAVGVAALLFGELSSLAAEPASTIRVPLGGETTVDDTSRNAFGNPAANLRDERLSDFFVGNSFFKRNWVQAPASTGARDGLGPLFNATSCAACHMLDGRALTTRHDSAARPAPGLLVRLSVPGSDEHGGPVPEPRYGGQFATQAVQGVAPEGELHVDQVVRRGQYADGTPYRLIEPRYRLTALSYGPMAPNTMLSPRLGPQIIGMGLLEAIPEADLIATAQRQASQAGSVRGRVNRVWDVDAGAVVVGRFGWKANVGSVAHQTAGAFRDDIGITSSRMPQESCTAAQPACLAAPRGGATGAPGSASDGRPEIDDRTIDKVIHYTRTLAVTAQREADHPLVLRGARLFEQAGCNACHVPEQRTGTLNGYPELSGQRIRPYTDLLLHDMGPGLADGRPDFLAGPRDWRTSPLWGIGLIGTVNGDARFLHDGRARDLAEAILWHGGEAEPARERFRHMARDDRAALLRFLNSL